MGARKYDHGRLWVNAKRRGPKDPAMLGTLYLNGSDKWSLALYKHGNGTGATDENPFSLVGYELRLTLQKWSTEGSSQRFYGNMHVNREKSSRKHPDLIGTIDVPFGRMSIAAWVNVNPAGGRFLKLTAYPL